MVIEEMKILGAILELPAKKHSRFGQFGPVLRQMGWIGNDVQLVAPKQLQGFSFFQLSSVPNIYLYCSVSMCTLCT